MNISIKNLTKIYDTQKAVDHISFDVKTGEILGFLGPNGAGKTTTMKMITQYLQPDEGQILFNGKSIKEEDIKKHIGYLPENNPLYLDMPVIDYLQYMALLQGVKTMELDAQVRKMVRLCGLEKEKHKKINELSKGYRQRVGLAQALIHDPEVLILDEPTTGLDPNQIVEIRELIKNIGKEKTVILSTHILPEVEATCDRILIINNGKIVADGTAETLRKQSQGAQVLKVQIEDGMKEEILAALDILGTVASVEYVDKDDRYLIQSQPDMRSNKAIFNLCKEKNWTLTELIPLETKLEDIFHDVTLN